MNYALIFAGGTGQRMNTKTRPKQFLELNGKPIIIHTIDKFEENPLIDAIVVVCVESWLPYMKELLEKYYIKKVKWVVPGGDTGQHSIRNGLYTLWNDASVEKDGLVLIHDGVRPLIDGDTISRCIACAEENGNAITVTAATETIINVTPDDKVAAILDRSVCKMARAPQTFRLRDIVGVHQKAEAEHQENMIDSAMLMEHYGFTLHTVTGPVENIKITTPPDYYIFRAIFEAQENSQIWGL